MCYGTTGLWWLAECNNMMDLYLPSTISRISNKLKCSECIKIINKIQRRSWRNETKSSDSPLVSIYIAQYDNAFYHFWLRLTPSAVWFDWYLLISSVNTTSVSEAWTDTGLSSEYYDLYLVDMICILLTAFHPMLLGQIVRYFWFPEINLSITWDPPSLTRVTSGDPAQLLTLSKAIVTGIFTVLTLIGIEPFYCNLNGNCNMFHFFIFIWEVKIKIKYSQHKQTD